MRNPDVSACTTKRANGPVQASHGRSHGARRHLVTASATFAFSLGTATVNKRGPSWWDRLRKQPFVDWIVKLMARTLIKELSGRVLEDDLFLRVRTASGAHGRSHAASMR